MCCAVLEKCVGMERSADGAWHVWWMERDGLQPYTLGIGRADISASLVRVRQGGEGTGRGSGVAWAAGLVTGLVWSMA